MSSVADWDRWWNLIFTVPFGLGALLVSTSVLSGGKRSTKRGGRTGGRSSGRGSARAASGNTRGIQAKGGQAKGAQTKGATQRGSRGKSTRYQVDDQPAVHSLSERLHLQNLPPVMLVQNFLLF